MGSKQIIMLVRIWNVAKWASRREMRTNLNLHIEKESLQILL